MPGAHSGQKSRSQPSRDLSRLGVVALPTTKCPCRGQPPLLNTWHKVVMGATASVPPVATTPKGMP
jgi:hypothetical protein